MKKFFSFVLIATLALTFAALAQLTQNPCMSEAAYRPQHHHRPPARPEPQQPTGDILFDNWNVGSVQSGPGRPTTFTLSHASVVTYISNYHYFNRGAKPGTIALRNSKGRMYGPWQAQGRLGQGGVENATWDVFIDVELPAGSYTVIDSDLSTWSHNRQSGNAGFSIVRGYRAPTGQQQGGEQNRHEHYKNGPANAPVNVTRFGPDNSLFHNNNGRGGVGPKRATAFTLKEDVVVTGISIPLSKGPQSGTVTIAGAGGFRVTWQLGGDSSSWKHARADGQILSAGTYTVTMSSPKAWVCNKDGAGVVELRGYRWRDRYNK